MPYADENWDVFRDTPPDPDLYSQSQLQGSPAIRGVNSFNQLASAIAIKKAVNALAAKKAAAAAVASGSGSVSGGALLPGGVSDATSELPVATSSQGGTILANGTVIPPENATTISNFAGSATPYLGAAGTALGAYEAFKGIKDKNPLTASLGGGGVGLGINAMGYALGPFGWGAALGIPAVSALINKLGDKDRWKEEQSARQKLADSGVTGWADLNKTFPELTGGRSLESMNRSDLAPDYVGLDSNGTWVNNKFNSSRNEADLKPEDIWGYSAFGNKYGNDWLGTFTPDQRKQIAQAYLDSGLVKEHQGQIDLGDNSSIDQMVDKFKGLKAAIK